MSRIILKKQELKFFKKVDSGLYFIKIRHYFQNERLASGFILTFPIIKPELVKNNKGISYNINR